MTVALVVINFTVVLLLVATAVLAWLEGSPRSMTLHMFLGMGTSFLGLFGHSFTLFHFLSTGKSIRDAIAQHPTLRPLLADSRAIRKRITGKVFLACTALGVLPLLGAAVYSLRLAPAWHQFGFFTTLLVQAWVAVEELKYLGLNNLLLMRVVAHLAASDADTDRP